MGFEISYTNMPEIAADYDVAIMTMYPQNWKDKGIKQICRCDPATKTIGFLGDPHTSRRESGPMEDKARYAHHLKAMNRFDRIISLSDEKYRIWFPEWVDRFVFFPDWYAPDDYYNSLPFNEAPIMKCLLTGTMRSEPYPLRTYVMENRNDKIDYFKSPGSFWNAGRRKKKYYVGNEYADLIHSYFCSLTCSMSDQYNYAVTKYIEIPATGCLLIATECPDVVKYGFVDGVNYVKITMENVFERIDHVLAHPGEYDQIRRNGMELVRSKYSLSHAYERLVGIIKELVP
jgi:hypothetical protein